MSSVGLGYVEGRGKLSGGGVGYVEGRGELSGGRLCGGEG